MKLIGAAFSSRCASRVSSLPLVSSSPIDSSPTRGRSTPSATRAYDAAHDARTAADAAAGTRRSRRRRAAPPAAARGNRRRQRRTIDAGHHAERGVRGHHRRAGVPGTERAPPRRRARRSSAATRIDARGLRRSAAAGASAMPIDVRRVDDRRIGSSRQSGCGASAASTAAVGADERDLRRPGAAPRPPRRRRSRTARGRRPSRRPRCASCISDACDPRDHVSIPRRPAGPAADVVVAAVRADAMRRLRLVALRAQARRRGAVSASCVRRLAVRVLECRAFWIRHVSLSVSGLHCQRPS